jgi:hypothetical protein
VRKIPAPRPILAGLCALSVFIASSAVASELVRFENDLPDFVVGHFRTLVQNWPSASCFPLNCLQQRLRTTTNSVAKQANTRLVDQNSFF